MTVAKTAPDHGWRQELRVQPDHARQCSWNITNTTLYMLSSLKSALKTLLLGISYAPSARNQKVLLPKADILTAMQKISYLSRSTQLS